MSALSPSVRRLIQEVGITEDRDDKSIVDGFLNWKQIQRLLPAAVDEPEYYESTVAVMAPVFNSAEKTISSLTSAEFQEKYALYLQWTGLIGLQMLIDCFALLSDVDECMTFTGMLLVTSLLERSVGDVFLIKSAPCPSMLKDLLVTEELRETFGECVIQVLRLLIGPPISLNLRNVIWHGFPAPGEIPNRYAWFLLLLVPSLGKILEDNGIEFMTIPHRQTIVCYPSLFGEEDVTGDIDLLTVKHVYEQSEIVSEQSLPLWKASLSFYKHGRFGHCTALLLTQLEHGLRRMFCQANNCPGRLLTAEATTLYTTFDEILDQHVETGVENHCVTQIGENLMNMLLDLLVYPEGPRVRDRLSHGQANWLDFPQNLAKSVIILSTGLALKTSSLSVEDSKIKALKNMCDYNSSYQSRFHPISIIKQKIPDVVELTSRLKSVIKYTPTLEHRETGSEVCSYWRTESFIRIHDVIGNILELLKNSWNKIHHVSLQDVDNRFMSLLCDGSSLAKELLDQPIRTLFRCRKTQVAEKISSSHSSHDSEVVCLLHHIISQCQEVMSQVTDTLVTRQQQLYDKILRSRQRENLKKLIESCPSLCLAVHMVMLLVIWCLYGLDRGMDVQNQHRQKLLIKFLKMMLQFCENLNTYTSVSKNKWTEAVDLGFDFVRNTQTYIQNLINDKGS